MPSCREQWRISLDPEYRPDRTIRIKHKASPRVLGICRHAWSQYQSKKASPDHTTSLKNPAFITSKIDILQSEPFVTDTRWAEQVGSSPMHISPMAFLVPQNFFSGGDHIVLNRKADKAYHCCGHPFQSTPDDLSSYPQFSNSQSIILWQHTTTVLLHACIVHPQEAYTRNPILHTYLHSDNALYK